MSNASVIPAQAGIQTTSNTILNLFIDWILAFARMTNPVSLF
ncbi:MAG TPA: hypothetical protein VLH19_00905 [Patescibacteria group bacterium]|nr:hypothetical protein [Patescibacteria group bacterium]